MKTVEPISDRLKRVRHMARMSQNELAARSGVNRAMIARYEQGSRTPGVYSAIDMANALRLTVGQLLGVEQIPLNWEKQWEREHE